MNLTATVAIDGISQARVIPVTVKGAASPDQAAVDTAVEKLVVNGLDDVRGNLTLPTAGANGVTVAWSSSDPAVIDGTGIVHRPAHGAAAASVELTATFTKGAASAEQDLPGDRARPARAGRARGVPLQLLHGRHRRGREDLLRREQRRQRARTGSR